MMMETSWTCVANGFRTVCSSRLSDRDWTLAVSASVVAVLGVGFLVWRMIQKDRARLERLGVAMDILLTLEAMSERRSDPSAEDLDAVAEEEKARDATGGKRETRRVVFAGGIHGYSSDAPAVVGYYGGTTLAMAFECPATMTAAEVNSYRSLVRTGVPR